MADIKNKFEEVGKAAAEIGKILGEKAADAGKRTGETIVTAAKDVGGKATEIAHKATEKVDGLVDLNGDGVVDQKDAIELLNIIYDKAVNGVDGKVGKDIQALADEYLKKYYSKEVACKKLMDNALIKCTTSGFVTGFGGLITLPVTLPANVTSVLYVQLRMIAAAACYAGIDLNSDIARTFVYACLAGVSVAEIIKKAGIEIGKKFANELVKKIPGSVLTKINQKVGFRLLTKFGSKGAINIGKMLPVVGAVIGGGFDFAETKVIAKRAYKQFIEGDFTIDEEPLTEIEDPIIEFQMVEEEKPVEVIFSELFKKHEQDIPDSE